MIVQSEGNNWDGSFLVENENLKLDYDILKHAQFGLM